MATELVRCCGYVPQDLVDLIDETSRLLGQSRSATVAEMLSAARPVLEVLRDLALQLEAAPEAHRAALAGFAASMGPLVSSAQEAVEDMRQAAADPRPLTGGSE